MKEKYLSPLVVSADTVEGNNGAFPAAVIGFMEAIAGAAAAGAVAGKVLKSAIKAGPTSALPSFVSRWRLEE